ncbi:MULTISPECIES: sugar ABC transporter substrate-binding protein [unclassified Pantoea]|uniref:sugar ABC transporter substrate-binding protein n=1 Tax=unclassified Pantoea TaxID=2630326 RepID=UPI001CD54D4B|nr:MULTISPECIES: sugar ABC transporter substrate-binding protein [unclassified Pantoea]MCA1179704.1 sugar ABC transporter substrate-binding protein [Pantoea sp. alder69]MCA1252299.1 sugar ABC transporter substrate-binding protein [Pantoea sp. alder70]MCA1268047.1 sugar ABC transporter substrate-binding protein [Pantoea sp. alder81]
MFKNVRSTLFHLNNSRAIDAHLDRLDAHGVSRREFLALATAGAAAAATASLWSSPAVAVVAPSGKLAYLAWTSRVEFMAQASHATQAASQLFGLGYSYLDGQIDSQRQLNQAEQQFADGANALILHAPDGSAVRRIAQLAQQNKAYFANVWATLPWYTPFDASDYYTLYAVPEEFSAHRGVTEVLLKAVTEKFGGGDIIGVTGVPGFSTDSVRSRGRDAAFASFPKTKLVDQLPGLFNREDSLKATQDLLSRHKNVVGVVAQNDDVAQGVIAALRANGLKPGEDVLVVGADGTTEGARAIKSGQQLATSANCPAFQAGFFTARLYDVLNGWQPRAAERMLNWHSVTMTRENVDIYLQRYVDNGEVPPFDYKLMSKVAHPNDWDPQGQITPLDIDVEWAGLPKPAGWQYPQAYLDAKNNGEWQRVTEEYRAHYKIPFFGPSPFKAKA